MIYIYALVSDDLVLYVGKTKDKKRREYEHRTYKAYRQTETYKAYQREYYLKNKS